MDGTLVDTMRLQPYLVQKYLVGGRLSFSEVQERMAVIYYLNRYTWFRPKTLPLFIRQFHFSYLRFIIVAPLIVSLYVGFFLKGERVFPGVKKSLIRLKRGGFRLGLVTNGTKFETKLKARSILECFDFIVTSSEASKKKPHPEMILKGIGKAGSTPEETLYVGDTIVDMKAAKRAGTRFALVTTGTFGPSVVRIGDQRPELTFRSIRELADWILSKD